MKFVALANAKGLKIGEPVYTLDGDGKYGTAKLVSRTENGTGTSWTFEAPQYFDELVAAPMVKPCLVTNITHVAVMRSKTIVDEAGTSE